MHAFKITNIIMILFVYFEVYKVVFQISHFNDTRKMLIKYQSDMVNKIYDYNCIKLYTQLNVGIRIYMCVCTQRKRCSGERNVDTTFFNITIFKFKQKVVLIVLLNFKQDHRVISTLAQIKIFKKVSFCMIKQNP